MIITGIGDEAGDRLEDQLGVARDLGWEYLELRSVQIEGSPKANLHEITEPAFDLVRRRLAESGVRVYCLASTIMNWSRRISDPFEITLGETQRAIARMEALGTRMVRIMSYKPDDDEWRIPSEVFKRVREITTRFLDHGLQPVHENCMNYGGMSWKHALDLLDKCPGLKWAFDSGNPISNPDRSKPKPWPKQDPCEFWENIREHVVHVHIKDAIWDEEAKDARYRWPGDGAARVPELVADLLKRNYQGAVSIEPHMVKVFHDPQTKTDNSREAKRNFLEYAKVLREIVESAEK
jgi:sugar phosphate isomerase/epimerase